MCSDYVFLDGAPAFAIRACRGFLVLSSKCKIRARFQTMPWHRLYQFCCVDYLVSSSRVFAGASFCQGRLYKIIMTKSDGILWYYPESASIAESAALFSIAGYSFGSAERASGVLTV